MNLAAPGYTLVAVVLVPLITWLVNVRLLGVQVIAWHGYDAQTMAIKEARYGSSDSERDSQAVERALVVAGSAALVWIAVTALTAPNLTHAPWPSTTLGMRLDAPGYVLGVVPFVYLGVWRLAVSDDDEHPREKALAIVGALALLWIVVSAIASYA